MSISVIVHELNDGSKMKLMTAKEFIKIPVWKGNRVIDNKHLESIQTKFGSEFEKLKTLDNGYRIVCVLESDAAGAGVIQKYVVDGQHRQHVLKKYYEEHEDVEDFNLLVIEKDAEDDSNIIHYFNGINSSKPIKWKLEPAMLVNNYIEGLVSEFNKPKGVLMIRPGKTRRPFLHSDDIRDKLLSIIGRLSSDEDDIEKFVKEAREVNTRRLTFSELMISKAKADEKKLIEKGVELEFMLGIDKELNWIELCI
jgi:hypothetical protein